MMNPYMCGVDLVAGNLRDKGDKIKEGERRGKEGGRVNKL
jgi:hypothetical protein